jgi:hypothetical protein
MGILFDKRKGIIDCAMAVHLEKGKGLIRFPGDLGD